MNNFFSSQDNPAKSYYPEALNFNADNQAQNQQDAFAQNFSQNEQSNSPFSNLFQGDFSKLFSNLNKNDMLSTLFASWLLNGNLNKNDFFMQALSGMMQKDKKEEKVAEKVVDDETTFEDL